MDIEEFEKRVKPSAKRSRLEPFRSQIFELKTKGYADWQVRDWLAANGLEVSRQAVQQFTKKLQNAPAPAAPAAGAKQAGEGSKGAEAAPVGGAVEALAAGAGKTLTETVLASEPKTFSFKQQQRKDQKS